LILDSLKKEESCFKDLIDKIGEQKKAIEGKDEVRVLEIIEEKNTIIEIFHFHEGEVNTRQQSLPLEEIQSLEQEESNIEELVETLQEESNSQDFSENGDQEEPNFEEFVKDLEQEETDL